MKVFANYDVTGKIRSVTWFNAPQGVSLMLTPSPGELVSEIEGHGLSGSLPSEGTLRELANSYVVAAPLARRALSKKK